MLKYAKTDFEAKIKPKLFYQWESYDRIKNDIFFPMSFYDFENYLYALLVRNKSESDLSLNLSRR